jgi:hypothetical protein
MAQTIENIAAKRIQADTTRDLLSFVDCRQFKAATQALFMPGHAKLAAAKIASSGRSLESDESVCLALVEFGCRPSHYAKWIDGMRHAALEMRKS